MSDVFKDDYCYSAGFGVDEVMDAEDPFVTDQTLTTFNAKAKMTSFLSFINQLSDAKLSQNLLVPMGCDFTFNNPGNDFRQIEKIQEYINANNDQNVTLVQSTPTQYV